MKIILSRKGFDSSYGGCPSPILPDGRLLSLPIPSNHDKTTFNDFGDNSIDIGKLISNLTNGRMSINSNIHLDPVLEQPSSWDYADWLPSLGQTGAAQGHLRKQNIDIGDIFLFFGWFREIEEIDGIWRYKRDAANVHVLYGWMEIGSIHSIVTDRENSINKYSWVKEHPHFINPNHYTSPQNTLYVSSKKSIYRDGCGGGKFKKYSDDLRLTAPDSINRTVWALPEWFYPSEGKKPLTYNTNLQKWSKDGAGKAILTSTARGQEFILDTDSYPEAKDWIENIIRKHS